MKPLPINVIKCEDNVEEFTCDNIQLMRKSIDVSSYNCLLRETRHNFVNMRECVVYIVGKNSIYYAY